jgi:DNA-binding MarR family transcriptional regulator
MTYQVPRMDERESRAWLALVWTAELLPAALDAQLQAEAGMTHFEFMVLSILQQEQGGAMRTTDLAAAVNATMPRLSRVVGKLTERDLGIRLLIQELERHLHDLTALGLAAVFILEVSAAKAQRHSPSD